MWLSGCSGPRPLTLRWPWARPSAAEDVQQGTAQEPRRLATLEPILLADAEETEGQVKQASGHRRARDTEVVSTVVARVNGEPIVAEDLVAPLRNRLAQARQSMSEAEYISFRDRLLRQQLDSLIERQLLVQAARRTFPEPVRRRMEAYADKQFEEQLKQEAKRLGLESVEELKQHLRKQGQSIERMRQLNRETILAQQFVRARVANNIEVTRREMLDYYKEHRTEFEQSPAVKWREIVVTVARHGSDEAARKHAEQLVKRLREGADFAELARAESDGATAAQGGEWPWTPPGSYIVDAVDEALFSLPVGQVSDPIPGPEGYHIVLVEDRRDGGTRPFEEVQDEIRERIRQKKIERAISKLIDELKQDAYIVTVFDAAESSD